MENIYRLMKELKKRWKAETIQIKKKICLESIN
jgi:hypothetical protein